MAMAWLWTGMVLISLIFGALTGNLSSLSAAALEGAQSAVELCFTMCGVMCLWTGVMELMDQCALTDKIAALFRPLLRRLLPQASRDSETLAAVSANLSADLLGLGNAATPLGIRAARRGCRAVLPRCQGPEGPPRGWRIRRRASRCRGSPAAKGGAAAGGTALRSYR